MSSHATEITHQIFALTFDFVMYLHGVYGSMKFNCYRFIASTVIYRDRNIISQQERSVVYQIFIQKYNSLSLFLYHWVSFTISILKAIPYL